MSQHHHVAAHRAAVQRRISQHQVAQQNLIRQQQQRQLLLLLHNAPPLHHELLDTADELREQSHYRAAVILAQTACELTVEMAFRELYRARGIPDCEDAIGALLRNYNIASSDAKARKLFDALTGREIAKEFPDWAKLVASAKLRNRVVHKGAKVTAAQADDAVKAARRFVAHIESMVAPGAEDGAPPDA